MNSDVPRRLGRGLEALIANTQRPGYSQAHHNDPAPTAPPPGRIPISSIRPNPFQPRREFKPQELKELEESLRTSGLLQPITVRPAAAGGGYELAAGERRLRAATNLGWTDIPASIRELNDRDLLAVALVENLQRSDLNPIEEAQGYARLLGEFGQTQQTVAELVGKDRSTVANMLRLLQLPAPVRLMLQSSSLSLGHARALLGLPNEPEMLDLAKEIVSAGLSVREVEKRVRVRKPTPAAVSGNRTMPPTAMIQNAHVRDAEQQLRKRLQTDVRIVLSGPDKGSVAIAFYNSEDLDRLLDLMLGANRQVG